MIRCIAGSNVVLVSIASPFIIFAKIWLSTMIRMQCVSGVGGSQSSSFPSFSMAFASSSSSLLSFSFVYGLVLLCVNWLKAAG